jgi:hypothetical protein
LPLPTTAAGAPTSPSGSPIATTSAGDLIQVGLDSNGQSVDLTVGQRLVVTLGPDWTPPAVTSAPTDPNTDPLQTESSVGFPEPQSAAGTFLALHTGTDTVTATTDYTCLHTAPMCTLPQQSFNITVQVHPSAATTTTAPPP